MSLKSLLISISFSVVMMLSAGVGADAQSRLSFGEYKITSVRPTSFTSMAGTVSIAVNNSGRKLTVTNVSGILYKDSTPFIIGTANDFVVPAGQNTVSVRGNASLQTMSALFAFLADPSINPADYTCDFTAEVKIGNKTQLISEKGVPLSKYLKK